MNVTIVHNFVSLSVTYEICAPHYSFEHRLVHNCAVIYIFKYTYIYIVIHHVLVHMFVHTYMSMYMFSLYQFTSLINIMPIYALIYACYHGVL